jgi:cytochrome c biogenesis protein CcmG/thiol:disulfide interchange protein DsbE
MKSSFTRLQTVAAVTALAVVAIAGCRSASHAGLEGNAAPAFTLQDSAGKTAALADYKGKVVLLDFWATWCHGCKEEIPWFAEFQRKYEAKGFKVVGVSMDDDWKTVKDFLANIDVPYRIVLGNNELMQSYRNVGMPDTFLIDRQGKIAAVYRGVVNKDSVEKDLQAALAE